MGRKGPAPKPTNLRILHGDRKDRINTAEPRPRDLPPVRPAWLSPAAAVEWDRLQPDLQEMGTVKAVDGTALACYCEAVARLQSALEALTDYGLLITGADSALHKNPAAGMVRDASNEIRLWAREFGLTPSSRSPLRVEHMPAGPGDRLLSPS